MATVSSGVPVGASIMVTVTLAGTVYESALVPDKDHDRIAVGVDGSLSPVILLPFKTN